MNKVSFEGISEWFTGKAAVKAKWAVDQINASLDEGEWLPGVSRTVKAALDKVNAKALHLARLADTLAESLPYESKENPELNEVGAIPGLKSAYRAVYWLLKYGKSTEADLDLIAQHAASKEAPAGVLEVLDAAKRVQAGRAPIRQAIAFLDAQRPKPVFVMKTLSPTGAKLLLEAGYKPDSSRLPEFVYHRELSQVTGKYECWVEIIWPKGTKHYMTRFCGSSQAGNRQCNACGHAIKNSFNWVPLAIDNQNGEIHSFWVGRDCAKKLFGVDMKGDAQYKNVEGR